MRILYSTILLSTVSYAQAIVEPPMVTSPEVSSIRFTEVATLGTCSASNKTEIKVLNATGTLFQCDGIAWRTLVTDFAINTTTGATPSGNGPASGQVLAMLTPVVSYGHIQGLGIVSRGGGTCSGGCPPGGVAVLRVYQGVKTLCTLSIPCLLAAGQRVDLTACTTAGQANQFSPSSVGGGPVLAEYSVTGQCTNNPSALIEAQYDVSATPEP